MKTYLGVDLGTSSIKLSLIDENGQTLAEASESYPIFQEGVFSEQEPIDWWNAFEKGLESLLVDQNRDDIIAMSFSGQMHGLVILDENDKVIRPCILWNDGRSEKEVDYLNNIIGKKQLNELTGNIAYAGFTAPKLLWLKKMEKFSFASIKKIMLPKDYLVYRLTGKHVTDYSDASGTLLLDCKNKCWSKEMLSICGISESQLPILHESNDFIGYINNDFKIRHHLGDVKVIMGAGDNACASIGMGVVEEGEINLSLGTSGTIFIPTNNFVEMKENKLHSFINANGKWHLMGCILTAASARKWWLETVLDDKNYQQDDNEVRNVNTDGLFFLPYLSGERSPHNDVNIKGALLGITHKTSKRAISKAIMEGVAFDLRDCLEVAKTEGYNFSKATICGGGSQSSSWCQIISDILELDIYVGEGSPSYGAALLAISGSDNKSLDLVVKNINYVKEYKPDKNNVEFYKKKYERFIKIYPAIKGI